MLLLYDTFKEGIEKMLPHNSGAGYLIHELSMYYYAFIAWKKKALIGNDTPIFTYHQKIHEIIYR